jgi:hypothetical protein
MIGRYPHANAEQPRGHPTAAIETIEPAMCHDEDVVREIVQVGVANAQPL